MQDLRINVNFLKPANFFGLTSLETILESSDSQGFTAKDYDELFDSPILFSKSDIAKFKVANTEFIVGVYNEMGNPLSEHFAEIIKPKMMALKNFVGGQLPVDYYIFLFYVKDFSKLEKFLIECPDFEWGNTKKALKINREYGYSHGAVEHNNCSLFCTSAVSAEQTSFELFDFIIHEFFHIYTPKSLHSNLIHDFDYVNPKLSAHRWLYEGVTEYFTGLIKLKTGLYDVNDFLQEFLRPKIQRGTQLKKPMSFIEFSKNANKEPYRNVYFQFYARGPILAMLLDFEIMRLTRGKKTLREAFFKIWHEYKNTPLEEDEIIPLFVEEVHPDLQLFFERYIVGKEPLDIESGFRTVGIKYKKEVSQKVPLFRLSYVPLFQYICIKKVDYPDVLKTGDKIHMKDWGRRGRKPFTKPDGEFLEEGEMVEVPLIRNGEDIKVSFPAKLKGGVYQHKITVMQEMTPVQKKLFIKWVNQ
ncbi:MAG: hypothetical protein JSV96_09210 [Candidatus Aminicenantes bacterium]|nr:MAG: hypothetical protein JSV96_09210 [Candidatus Aminicenantes bacterium]